MVLMLFILYLKKKYLQHISYFLIIEESSNSEIRSQSANSKSNVIEYTLPDICRKTKRFIFIGSLGARIKYIYKFSMKVYFIVFVYYLIIEGYPFDNSGKD